ncbi:aminodeoxychorismate synthase component I [Shewanella aegiceratis]|uniref:aminodeoxychorismate synthase component I n=1 Tax=Shewanella aegiceratis TaxID=2864203 RepID=UPI001C65FF64|nr:aminodeoxychorismate synthase component I [Shewanella aegiceratis]QYJ84223.1 aminodeoxychorismate synthase component I [Shewanella aegiceratis]
MDISSTQGVALQKLDWQLSTIEVFDCFAHLPWAILLDSAGADHIDARYDIISFDPLATITSQDGVTQTRHLRPTAASATEENRYKNNDETSQDDPFSILQAAIADYFPIQHACELPFSGGALGTFNYDLGRRIEKLPATAAQDIELPEMNVGLYDWALLFCYQSQTWSLVHYRGETALKERLADIEARLSSRSSEQANGEKFALSRDWQPQITKDEYRDKFDRVQDYLHSGDCYQINLTQRFEAEYRGDEWQAYLKLRASNKAPFSAFIRLDKHAILSISPERFIKLKADAIETKPIKGTMARSSDAQADKAAAEALAASEKDRAENLMIVDLLRNDIGKVASPGSVRVPHLFAIESFPAVHHLVSTVTANLAAPNSPCDLLRAAFPGGSITGAPKIRAMEIIEELEPSRRSLYCGSIGYISQDRQMDTSITIRTLVAEPPRLYCWAGGGIVADSQVDAEYQESYDKVSKILPVLSH